MRILWGFLLVAVQRMDRYKHWRKKKPLANLVQSANFVVNRSRLVRLGRFLNDEGSFFRIEEVRYECLGPVYGN